MRIIRQLSVSCAWLAAMLLSLSAIAQPASEGTITYIVNDLLGSPVVAMDQSGAVIWRESFSGYGERKVQPADTAQSPCAANKVWYTSRHQDEDTGLVYMGARYYDPALGRFLSVDPVGFSEGNVHSFNRYAYANNNPFKFKDPDGRQATFFWGTVAVGIAGSIYVANCEGCKQNIRDAAGSALDGIRGLRNWISSESADGGGTGGANSGDKDPSTPTGQRGSPMDVKNGTNEATTIGGREYGGHALDQMQGRGVPPAAVEDAIQNGNQSQGNKPGRTVHTGEDGRVSAVTEGGKVVTVITK